MDAFAHGALGGNHRTPHRPVVRADHERQAPSGDGVSRLPGHYPAGGEVLGAARGSRLGACIAHRRVPLQERRVDLEELARPGSTALAAASFHAAAR